jgi:hypothetical protein
MPQGRSVVGFIGLGDNDGRGMSHMRALPLCAVLATLLYFGQAAAQQPDWPGSKPIRFEVTAAAGGLPDIVPRTLIDLYLNLGRRACHRREQAGRRGQYRGRHCRQGRARRARALGHRA